MFHRVRAPRLFLAVLLLTLLAVPVSAAPEQPTIIGGQTAAAGEFPYMVALVQAGGGQFCGGSLITANWVLTAAHCFFNEQNQQDTFAADVNIVAGSVDLSGGGGQTVGVTRIVHQGYDQNQLLDIALLELAQPITLGGGAGLIAFNAAPATPVTGALTTITGWGATAPDGNNPSDQLLKVQLPVVACDQGDDPALFICAGGVEGEDSCQGDSGGPLVVADGVGSFLQIGVTSSGPETCAQAGQYGIYTRVSQYSDWINQTVGVNMPPIEADNYVYLPAVSR